MAGSSGDAGVGSGDRLQELLGVVARGIHSPAHAVSPHSGSLGSEQHGHRVLGLSREPRVELARIDPGQRSVVDIGDTPMLSALVIVKVPKLP